MLSFGRLALIFAVKGSDAIERPFGEKAVLFGKFCKGGHGRAGLGGLAEVGFLVLL
jgi:hypothetical protein